VPVRVGAGEKALFLGRCRKSNTHSHKTSEKTLCRLRGLVSFIQHDFERTLLSLTSAHLMRKAISCFFAVHYRTDRKGLYRRRSDGRRGR
jgi:hypothetical protein